MPEVDLLPLQPPVAVQVVALVVDQVRVEEEPVLMVEGVAVKEVMVGIWVVVTVTVTELLPVLVLPLLQFRL